MAPQVAMSPLGVHVTSVSTEFHQLLDAVPDAMVVIDQYGRVAALNMEAERFFGWPEDEVVGHPLTRLVPDRFQHMLDAERDAHRASVAFAPPGASVSCFARRGAMAPSFPVNYHGGFSAKVPVPAR